MDKNKFGKRVWDRVRERICNRVWNKVFDRVWNRVRARVWDRIWYKVRDRVNAQVSAKSAQVRYRIRNGSLDLKKIKGETNEKG